MKNRIALISLMIFMFEILPAQNLPESADVVLKDACRQAAAGKKNVMIIFHASWCVWCKSFEASINDPSCKEFFDRNFVIKYLTVLESKDKKYLENPGAEEIYEKYGGTGSGIPFFLIFDSSGKLLADSKMPIEAKSSGIKRSNIGCPATEEEIAAFIEILKKTSSINNSQIEAIKKRFSQNRN